MIADFRRIKSADLGLTRKSVCLLRIRVSLSWRAVGRGCKHGARRVGSSERSSESSPDVDLCGYPLIPASSMIK